DTFIHSLDSLAPLGLMVSFGNSSGPVPPFDGILLSQKGSLFFTRPTLMHYAAKRQDLVAMAAELFDVVESGAVKIEINQTYRLFDAAHAHRDLESRKTTGSTVLLPEWTMTPSSTARCSGHRSTARGWRSCGCALATAGTSPRASSWRSRQGRRSACSTRSRPTTPGAPARPYSRPTRRRARA